MAPAIDFTGNQRTNPRWCADFVGREQLEPWPAKLDKASFTNFYGVSVVVGVAGAAQNAVSIPVASLAPPLPSTIPIQSVGSIAIKAGTFVNFGGTKLAYVTTDAKYGDVAIAVAPLPTALVSGDTALVSRFGTIFVPSGILVGRTFASRDSGTGLFQPVTDPTLMDEMYLTAFDIPNLNFNNDVEFIRANAGIRVKENYLPQWSVYNADPGVADPTTGPVLSVAGADGLFGVGTYYGAYTWVTAGGETKRSQLSSIAVAATNHLTFPSIAFPAGVIARKFYVGPSIGDPDVQYQGQQVAAAAYNALTPGNGATPPAYNGTKTGFGRQIDVIRRLYGCIKGAN